MKKIMCGVVLMVSALSMGCGLTVEQARANTPKGATVCHTDFDCGTNSYCGFAGVDQLPTCRYSPGADAFSLQ